MRVASDSTSASSSVSGKDNGIKRPVTAFRVGPWYRRYHGLIDARESFAILLVHILSKEIA
jgi:hypothetical protein